MLPKLIRLIGWNAGCQRLLGLCLPHYSNHFRLLLYNIIFKQSCHWRGVLNHGSKFSSYGYTRWSSIPGYRCLLLIRNSWQFCACNMDENHEQLWHYCNLVEMKAWQLWVLMNYRMSKYKLFTKIISKCTENFTLLPLFLVFFPVIPKLVVPVLSTNENTILQRPSAACLCHKTYLFLNPTPSDTTEGLHTITLRIDNQVGEPISNRQGAHL